MSEAQERTAGPCRRSNTAHDLITVGDVVVASTDASLIVGSDRTPPAEQIAANAVYLAKCWNGYPKAIEALRLIDSFAGKTIFSLSPEFRSGANAAYEELADLARAVLSDLQEDSHASK